MPHATVRHPNHEQSQRNRLRRPLLVDLRTGTAVHRHAAPRRFFTVRGVDLPLGRRLGGAAALRAGDGPAAAHRPQGLRRRLPAEPLPGRLFAEPRLRLCQHCHRRRFDHSFPLSAGRRAGHDALFSANAVRGGCSRPSPFRSPAPHCSRRATSVRTAATRRSASPRPSFR